MINDRESLLCNLLPVKFAKCSIALFSFNTFYVGKWFMYVISLDSNLKYNFIVLYFTHCGTNRSCGRRVMCQYFLWKIMRTLLISRSVNLDEFLSMAHSSLSLSLLFYLTLSLKLKILMFSSLFHVATCHRDHIQP